MTFRTLKRTASQHTAHTGTAVGHVGKVIVPCSKEGLGKIRIQLRGQSVDLLARTQNLRIDIGERVVVEDVEGEVAQVSRAPIELQDD